MIVCRVVKGIIIVVFVGRFAMDGRSLLSWAKFAQTVPPRQLCRLSREEVAKHSTADDAWMILHGAVFDVTSFLRYHPGGVDIMLPYLGKDGTAAFGIQRYPCCTHLCCS